MMIQCDQCGEPLYVKYLSLRIVDDKFYCPDHGPESEIHNDT